MGSGEDSGAEAMGQSGPSATKKKGLKAGRAGDVENLQAGIWTAKGPQ